MFAWPDEYSRNFNGTHGNMSWYTQKIPVIRDVMECQVAFTRA
jgi:hypothetical protein